MVTPARSTSHGFSLSMDGVAMVFCFFIFNTALSHDHVMIQNKNVYMILYDYSNLDKKALNFLIYISEQSSGLF